MRSRRIYPWLTSGAAMVGKRESMKKIMEKHSLFFNGGDIEIGKIANLTGLKVDHIPVTFYTDVPETFPKLAKQRFSWFCGAFRHSIINAHTNLFSPFYSIYFTLIIFLMLPLKMYELFVHWFILPFLILFYMFLTLVSNWSIRSRYMLLFPFYSLFQVIVLPVLGIYTYIKTVKRTKNFGLIKVFYKHKYSPLKYTFNILLILGITFAIFNVSLIEETLFLSNLDLLNLVGVSFQSSDLTSIFYNGFKLFLIICTVFLLLLGSFKLTFYMKTIYKHPKTKYLIEFNKKIFSMILS